MESWEIAILVISIVVFIFLIIFVSRIRIIKQTEKGIVERLGAYNKTWNTGIHVLVPFVDSLAQRISMKEQVKYVAPQPGTTKDKLTMKIDTVVFYQVTDPKLYAYGVENPMMAIENLSATTLRNIIGELDLDSTLTSRDLINARMRAILDEATDAWGIKVNRVEVKNILPPKDIRESMERQMRAEREKREKILLAEGEKQSAILLAQGKKESMILNADGEKQAAILQAEGRAASILKIKEAEAEGLRMIKESAPDAAVLTLKSYEALTKVADGQATKIIIPSDIQNVATLATSVAEIVKEKKQ